MSPGAVSLTMRTSRNRFREWAALAAARARFTRPLYQLTQPMLKGRLPSGALLMQA
jgi:hypothetical protein